MENVLKVMFSPEEKIFNEGDPSNSIYLIIKGKVEISRQKDRKKLVLAIQSDNTLFGEMALIDGKPRSATATALEDTICYKCSAAGILQEFKKIDREVSDIMTHFVSLIRKNNEHKLNETTPNETVNKNNFILDKNIKELLLTKEDILKNKPLQEKIEKLSPFLKSMYRVLMQVAYE